MPTEQHRSARWNTPFGRFVRTIGVSTLAHELQVEPAAIYQWIRGHTSPRPPKARVIVLLSKQRATVITIEDVYAQKDLHADQNER